MCTDAIQLPDPGMLSISLLPLPTSEHSEWQVVRPPKHHGACIDRRHVSHSTMLCRIPGTVADSLKRPVVVKRRHLCGNPRLAAASRATLGRIPENFPIVPAKPACQRLRAPRLPPGIHRKNHPHTLCSSAATCATGTNLIIDYLHTGLGRQLKPGFYLLCSKLCREGGAEKRLRCPALRAAWYSL